MAQIIGTAGDDALAGGAENDTLDGGAGGEILTGGGGADTFVFRAWEGGRWAGGPERITDFQLGVDRVQTTGAFGYQPWVENAVQDGVAGTVLTWGWNDDRVFVAGVSNATVEQLASPPSPTTTTPSPTPVSQPPAAGQMLMGTTGPDAMVGGAGDDTIRSSAGDDTIDGGAGADTYVLSLGRGSFVVTSPGGGALTIHTAPGGPGSNFGVDTVTNVEAFQLVSSNTTETVPAGEMLARYNYGYSHAPTAGNDKLLGTFGADGLNGLAGDDTVEGSNGDDWIAGGAGADALRGGEGADVFVFYAWEGAYDRIEDFEVGRDRLQFNTAFGYGPWAQTGTDAAGASGTWVRWGWDSDAVFLRGVTGVGVEALLL